jgi:hypothetical protein
VEEVLGENEDELVGSVVIWNLQHVGCLKSRREFHINVYHIEALDNCFVDTFLRHVFSL